MADVEATIFVSKHYANSASRFLHLGVPKNDAMQAADVLAARTCAALIPTA